ncbi:hypothetical protein SAMN05443507_11912 [Alicyclobacillus tolerans]|uniref:Uncharacterized protein n=1 Tax=Alicyclobacillus tolerans TaxID=90970 RepID=A0A1M6U9E7_9BACL|nr:hypothetical protein SAMN05443507_11912 [Alicyclobacillus montanus]
MVDRLYNDVGTGNSATQHLTSEEFRNRTAGVFCMRLDSDENIPLPVLVR